MIRPFLTEQYRGSLYDVAADVAQRLVESACWSGRSCTWWIHDQQGATSGGPAQRLADGAVYAGSGGIALFLAELAVRRTVPAADRTAEGAVRHALACAESLAPGRVGFYEGRTGVAYVAMRVGELLGVPEFVHAAREIVRTMDGHEQEDEQVDVIAGAAGAIPALLRLEARLGGGAALDVALRLGAHLLRRARREPGGWSWDLPLVSVTRNMTGHAHGASGIASGLLALYGATADTTYLYGAEQALGYERQFFDPRAGSWITPRHAVIREFEEAQRLDVLGQRLLDGAILPSYDPHVGCSWCYGAPGMIAVRARVEQATHDPVHATEAAAAVRATLASLDASRTYSLCHGAVGNADALLHASRILRDDRLASQVLDWAARIPGWYYDTTGDAWQSGIPGGGPDPTLLLGKAGLGYFCLRAADPDLDSVLFLDDDEIATATPDAGWRAPHDARYAAVYFADTMASFGALGECDVSARAAEALPSETPPRAVHREVVRRIADQRDDARRQLLEDASLLDRTRFELVSEIDTLTHERVTRLQREALGDAWRAHPLMLARRTRVVAPRWDWTTWAAREAAERSPTPGAPGRPVLLYCSELGPAEREADPLMLDLIAELSAPTSLETLLDDVADIDAAAELRAAIRESVTAVVTWLYAAGAIVPVVHRRATPTRDDAPCVEAGVDMQGAAAALDGVVSA